MDDILLGVHKPARYIGNEYNVSKKDFAKAEVKFALCFPDLYEVGMSNLGIRILYGVLNNVPEIVCERFFSPAIDFEKALRLKIQEIFSLESKKPLRDFDIVGFSLGYELLFTNVLNILDLGGIPLKSCERGENHPLIIAGGPCVLNPEPMHEFIDLFVIGEAEEAVLDIVYRYKENKGKSRRDLLLELAKIEGVYVPALGVPKLIKKRFIKDFNNSYFPADWIVPYIQIIHDRITLEVMRGCPNRCRFCQARALYYPWRTKSKENILKLGLETYKKTGYEDVSLCGLSVSDYPQMEELLKELVCNFKEKGVSISLPSIKPRDIVGNLSYLISTIKKTGLTFAPEVGTEKMRNIIGKDFDLNIFWEALAQAYTNGYQHIKLYFMIGLPFEEESDLEAIVALASEVSELKRKINKSPAQVNISVNTLIPKPHTAFQRFGMLDLAGMRAKENYIKSKVKNKRLRFSFHNHYMSLLEGVLSRGDRLLSKVILCAFKKGARFDAWDEHFNFARWQEAFVESGINYEAYLKERPQDEPLPWDFIDTGVSKDYLRAEENKIIAINQQ
ncbi:MAG: TIGR03960 family B12-binding radical SAM protein [Candidatus Omnitrophota bacterium]